MKWHILPLAAWFVLCPRFAWIADAEQPLWEITILTCLQMNPATCSSHTLQAQQLSPNPSTAYREAMAIVARWMDERPGLILKGFDMAPGVGS
jgi:hypothetical protein